MKVQFFSFLFFMISGLDLPGQQDTSLVLAKMLKGSFVSFTVDNLDNIYLLNEGNQLKKLYASGDSAGVFNDVRKYGKLTYMDVSNPLRVLLYYKDFSTVVVLDRFLNIRNTIDLRKQNIFQVQAIGLSYDNNIWVYDEFENKLKKIDEDGKLIFETADFRQLFNEPFSPSVIYDESRHLYLYDKQKGVFVFDYFGTLKNRIPLAGWNNFKVAGQYLFGIKNDSIMRYNPSTFIQQEFLFPSSLKDVLMLNFTSSFLYALKKEGLEIYRIR